MDYETIRGLVIEFLKKSQSNLEFNTIVLGVQGLALEKRLIQPSGSYLVGGAGGRLDLNRKDRFKVIEILWEFILQRIISPGIDDMNFKLPWIHITDFGKKFLSDEKVLPQDPEGYLKELDSEIPHLDPIAKQYVEESLQTYLVNCPLASTVMLGVASEKIILLLIDAYINAIEDNTAKTRLSNKIEKSFMIKLKYDLFKADFDARKSSFPRDLIYNAEIWMEYVYHMIRNYRNDAGHPSEAKITRDLAFANLRLFIPYVKNVYRLIAYFQSNSI